MTITPPEPVAPSSGPGHHEEALQLLEGFLGLMPDAAIVVDEGATIVSVNEQAEALFGYPAAELVGRTIEILVPERFRHQHRTDRAGYLRSPQTRPMGAGLELSGRRRDGSEFPVDISLAPLTDSERPLVVAAVRDASERRAASAAQAQLAAIVQTASAAIVSMSVDCTITSWNPGAEHLFGYPAALVTGRHISLLVPDDASGELEELLDAAGQGGSPTTRDTQWLRRDGSRVDVAVSVSPLTDASNRTLGFSAVLRDVTERKQADAALRRALAEERRRKRQQEATADIRLSLLSGNPVGDVLVLICERAGELLAAAAAIVVCEDERLHVEAAAGKATHVVGRPLSMDGSLAGRVVSTGRTQIVACLDDEPGIDRSLTAIIPAGPALGVAVPAEHGVQGALVVTRSRDADVFTEDDVSFAAGMADQAGLAFELGRARRDREELVVAHDRERIARDLHDVVIQRLFATGMGLEGVARLTQDGQVKDRVSRAVDDLDTTIRDIRNTIFGLEMGRDASGLRADLLRLTAGAAEALGFEPTLRFSGAVDHGVPDRVVPHVLAVVREGLSNATRHAHASSIDVEVRVGDEVVVVVADDGIGVGEQTRRSGLVNLRQRAEGLGGRFVLSSEVGAGTRLEWTVPVVP